MKIAIIGGTGVCDSSFISSPNPISVQTEYGEIELLKGHRGGHKIYFLERHSKGHKLTPSQVNYKGNIQALKKLQIDFTIATAAVGAINNCKAGDFVILDQFIDFTKNRSCTYFDQPSAGVVHIDMSTPYCSTIRNGIISAFKAVNAPVVENGTYVCTEGPRFETPAEISMFKLMGADVVGMTNVPEVVLARESALCYATIALATNYAAGISSTPLTHKEVNDTMCSMSSKLQEALAFYIDNMDSKRNCTCKESLKELNSLK